MDLRELINMAIERIKEVAGNADGDGLIGMDRLYYYEAVKLIIEGIHKLDIKLCKTCRRFSKYNQDKTQKSEYIEIAECLEWIAHNKPRTFREAIQLTYIIHIAVAK